jgi:hypothetical protein
VYGLLCAYQPLQSEERRKKSICETGAASDVSFTAKSMNDFPYHSIIQQIYYYSEMKFNHKPLSLMKREAIIKVNGKENRK